MRYIIDRFRRGKIRLARSCHPIDDLLAASELGAN